MPQEKMPPKGRYRHFKGNEYELLDFAKDSEFIAPFTAMANCGCARFLCGSNLLKEIVWCIPTDLNLLNNKKERRSAPFSISDYRI